MQTLTYISSLTKGNEKSFQCKRGNRFTVSSSFYTLYEHAPKGFIEKKGVHSKGFYLKLNNQKLIILLSTRLHGYKSLLYTLTSRFQTGNCRFPAETPPFLHTVPPNYPIALHKFPWLYNVLQIHYLQPICNSICHVPTIY